MTVQCIDCAHADLRSNPAMARAGLAGCAVRRKVGRFFSLTYGRDCAKFASAEPDSIAKRRAWLSKKGGKA